MHRFWRRRWWASSLRRSLATRIADALKIQELGETITVFVMIIIVTVENSLPLLYAGMGQICEKTERSDIC